MQEDGTAVDPDDNSSGAVMDSNHVAEATPYPIKTNPTLRPGASATPARTAQHEYPVVLHEKLNNTPSFSKAWTIEVPYPPMIVEAEVIPEIESRKVLVTHGSKEKWETVTRPSANSRLSITIRDEDGNIVKEDGFGGLYSSVKEKKVKILSPGTYLLDLRGGHVEVDLTVKVGNTVEE
ncbi:hypothetical protein [Methanofollis sp. W23]|uniref:hypothetical protein n=1 Tax=Methanofollis sp. W23 TaxID=2817849 RepID=UPI001AE6BAE5|nr:hypothetical protein [Methanofollis sp. W23]